MRPALSVIFFTVSSGAGLGLLIWLAALTPALPAHPALAMLALGMALTTAGLISSTLHLANPRNAWRAFSQIRTSWLSREGVLAVALYPLAALHGWLLAGGAPALLLCASGAALALVALGVLFCTGMIYACLRTVPRWNTPLVPLIYVSLGTYSGALAALPVMAYFGGWAAGHGVAVMCLLAAAFALKAAYYLRFGTPAAAHTVNDALALGKKSIRLLDVGHTHGNFLTHEFCFALARGHARMLRVGVVTLGFAVPFAALAAEAQGVPALAVAALCAAVGLLMERWLFFAEAQHVVRLYHGAQAVR